MNLVFCTVLFVFISSRNVSANIEKAKFYSESVSNQQSEIFYKRMAGWHFGPAPINSVQCAFACKKNDNCKSVHVDGEACVFGVHDVTAFEEGELVTPNQSQNIRIKGKFFLRNKTNVIFFKISSILHV